MRGPKRYPRKRGPMVKWRRSRERAKRVPLTMGQGEMEEEEGESEAPLTLPHGCFVTLAILPRRPEDLVDNRSQVKSVSLAPDGAWAGPAKLAPNGTRQRSGNYYARYAIKWVYTIYGLRF